MGDIILKPQFLALKTGEEQMTYLLGNNLMD